VLTETPSPAAQRPPRGGQMRVEVARGWRVQRLLAPLGRMRLGKLLEMFVWPDESIFWVGPASLAGRRLIDETTPSAIVVFMMPYSAGLAGIALSRLKRLPLILNLDDSPTCTDMHPHFPTRLHYRLARALEDLYARYADAVIYVSATNLEKVRARQPVQIRQKFHLVRYGAEPADFRPQPERAQNFDIAYVGAMAGWWTLIGDSAQPDRLRRIYGAWTRLGRYTLTTLDQRTASPAIIGNAIVDAIAAHPDWTERIKLTIYDNTYPAALVTRALAAAGVQGVVTAADPVPHDEVAEILSRADLLFLTLPRRVDRSRGGRISAKTYEYLMTDRPILAAVPPGESWDYLSDKPGVFLVEPDDQQRMTEVIAELAGAKFAGAPRSFDRSHLHEQLSYEARAGEFASVVNAGIERGLAATGRGS
jgi:Glycosyl transferase 4-like domain